MIDYRFLYWYICGLAFTIALLITGYNSFHLGQWILVISIGTVINIMANIHFYSYSHGKENINISEKEVNKK